MDYDRLCQEVTRDEGRRRSPYYDSVGKLTIGVGWNLTDNPLPDEVVDLLLKISLARAERDALALFPSLYSLSDARQRVLVNMAFNLGISRLGGFRRLRSAVAEEDFAGAAREMLDSKWARQVGLRAHRLAKLMEEG